MYLCTKRHMQNPNIYISVYLRRPGHLYICVPIYEVHVECQFVIPTSLTVISTAYGIIQTREGFPRSDIIINRLWPACAQSGKQIRLQRWQKKVNSYQYRKKLTPSFHNSFIINNGCLPLLMPICIRIHINLYICAQNLDGIVQHLYICVPNTMTTTQISIFLCTNSFMDLCTSVYTYFWISVSYTIPPDHTSTARDNRYTERISGLPFMIVNAQWGKQILLLITENMNDYRQQTKQIWRSHNLLITKMMDSQHTFQYLPYRDWSISISLCTSASINLCTRNSLHDDPISIYLCTGTNAKSSNIYISVYELFYVLI